MAELQPDRLRWPLVAERQGRVEGYLMAWRVQDQLHVLNLAVRPSVRRQGTGSRLLQAALAAVQAWGLREVTLEVRESNLAALRFYTAHDFVAVGRRLGYYRDTHEDAIIMTWTRPTTHA